ncbi:MAG: PrsW family intramembrane metalloprotease [Ardenticatenaceae bacterium]|nr:PrsW family intramembrane metalloprotease [Ardenticatenaceae bacterium]
MMILSMVVATAIPLVALYLIYQLDLYASRSYQLVIASFVWGGVAVGITLVLANQLVFGLELLDTVTLSRYVAPVTEEVVKALFLFFLVRQARFTYFVDGAIYGFAVGMGFAIIENWLYLSNNPELPTAVGRVISTNLMHATATAIMGIALGQARFERWSGRILWVLFGLVAAIGLHAGFNNLVTRLNGRFLLLYAALSGLAGLGFIVYMIKRGLAEQKQWIEEKLGAEDRVTAGETAVVHRLAHVYDILTPLAAQFGPDKAQKIEDFLMLQARIGILRKTLDKMKDDKMRQGIQTQIATLSQQMDDARREVGPYCMIYLRNIFPEQTSPIWQQLENRIQTRPQASPATNIWANLSQRTQSPDNG